MYLYQTQLKQNKKINISLKKIGAVLTVLFLAVSVLQIPGTNSYFTDEAKISGIKFKTGIWIPTLEMEVNPEESAGEDGWFAEPPCVKFNSDIEEVTIYYSFAGGDETIDGEIDEDTCVYPPEGESELSAWAVNDENDDWISSVITQDFKVGYKVNSGDVVINEIMWMGSADDKDDEWIELRNMTDREIDLSNWDIKYAGKGKNAHIEIPHGYSIKANGYFLLTAKKWDDTAINLNKDLAKDEGYSHISSMDLADDGEQLVLKNKNKDIIDEAWQDKKWPDGWHGIFLHMSMERDNEAGDGKLKSSWHTCIDKKCNDKDYWHKEWLNFGTPGKKNSSRNNIEDVLDAINEREDDLANVENNILPVSEVPNVEGAASIEDVSNAESEAGENGEEVKDVGE